MFKIIFFVLLSLLYLGSLNGAPYSCVVDWFQRAGLNKVVHEIPRSKLMVYYGDSLVNLGATFTPTQARFQPTVYFGANSNSLYTLVMFDPDAGEYSQGKN